MLKSIAQNKSLKLYHCEEGMRQASNYAQLNDTGGNWRTQSEDESLEYPSNLTVIPLRLKLQLVHSLENQSRFLTRQAHRFERPSWKVIELSTILAKE
ncbi:hypothetical protein TNCV_4874391 [Trichonephila clavipes]|nr:hypothetical protein TNCV_4874391 [Trichonephila clavipes]